MLFAEDTVLPGSYAQVVAGWYESPRVFAYGNQCWRLSHAGSDLISSVRFVCSVSGL